MSRSYWVSVFAVVGWLIVGPSAYTQETASPALESKPVAPGEETDSPGDHQDGGSKGEAKAEKLVPSLEKIESAIRDLVAKPDEDKEQRAENRDIADLQAQEDMALWAKRMTWATVASVLLTVLGIILIWRTLIHTKRAADAADELKIQTVIRNFGKTPGFVRSITLNAWSDRTSATSVTGGEDGGGGIAEQGFYLAADDSHDPINEYGTVTFDKEAIDGMKGGSLCLFVSGVVIFDNSFGDTWRSGFAFRLNVKTNPDGKQKNVHIGGPDAWYVRKNNT